MGGTKTGKYLRATYTVKYKQNKEIEEEINIAGLTEGLLELQQAGHLWGHVVQVGLQSSTDQQREGQVCDVDAHNGKRVAGKSRWKYKCKKLFFVCLVVFVVTYVIFCCR